MRTSDFRLFINMRYGHHCFSLKFAVSGAIKFRDCRGFALVEFRNRGDFIEKVQRYARLYLKTAIPLE